MLSFLKFFANKKQKDIFIIHKHFSHRAGLHYDLRMKVGNVLRCWASKNLLDLIEDNRKKIILFATKDHPLEWLEKVGKYKADFYEIFDSGKYTMIKESPELIEIEFKGDKLKGIYIMIKQRNNKYLFFKKN